MPKLEGIIYKAFGNYVVLRGFARIVDIASVSEKPDSYQRDANVEHMRDIVKFIDEGIYKFFPEVILSCRANDYATFISNIGSNDLITPDNAVGVEGLTIKNEYIPFESNRANHASLELENIRLKRVDGNHRLSPFDLNYNDEHYNEVWGGIFPNDLKNRLSQIVIPFCIVFTNEDNADQFEAAIFNNINFKQLPLKQEKNLHNIHKHLPYSDELGEYHQLVIKLIDLCDKGYFKGLDHLSSKAIDDENIYRTSCYKIAKLIIDKAKEKANKEGRIISDIPTADDIEMAIHTLRPVYAKFGNNKGNISLLAALVYYKVTDVGKFNNFVEWVINNGINNVPAYDYLPSHNAASLVDLFEQVYESKRREVFISMQFGDPQSELIYEKIVRAIEAYNKQENRDIQIQTIRIDRYNRGETYTITDEILNAIDSCSLLIADLSSGNKNVYHEIGYAMALAKVKRREPSVLLLLKEDSDKIGKGEDVDKFVGFNIRGFSQLRFTQYEDLVAKLIEQLKTHFSL